MAAKPLSKTKIVAHIAEKVGTPKKTAATFFEELFKLAVKEAKGSAGKFVIPGIGKLVLARSAPREMVMRFGPKTGQTVKVPAKTRVKFRVAKAAKDAILGAKK